MLEVHAATYALPHVRATFVGTGQPVHPALHRQSAADVIPAGAFEFAGQSAGGAWSPGHEAPIGHGSHMPASRWKPGLQWQTPLNSVYAGCVHTHAALSVAPGAPVFRRGLHGVHETLPTSGLKPVVSHCTNSPPTSVKPRSAAHRDRA